ncbi:hypothetical protein XPA_006620 [Xanthoria parietina]
MPHVRRAEYPTVNSSHVLEYVETYPWYCDDEALFYYGAPLPTHGANNHSANTYWSVYTSSANPLSPRGFNGTCQFPQITRGGLDDSWQHGHDLYGVYHDLLGFLPEKYDPNLVSFRVTNNVITSQVAGMVTSGMFGGGEAHQEFPLLIQPASIDGLEPGYTCPAAKKNFSVYGVGSSDAGWTSHLQAAAESIRQSRYHQWYSAYGCRLPHVLGPLLRQPLRDGSATPSRCPATPATRLSA